MKKFYNRHMVAVNLVSPEEYLASGLEFPAEYVDGILLPKQMPTRLHAQLQAWISALLLQRYAHFVISTELICRLSESEFRLPDIAVELRANTLGSTIATEPLYLAIEIRSSGDRFGAALSKLERYHDWGVPHCWLIEPEQRRVWAYDRGQEAVLATSQLDAGEISLSVAEIFSILDR